MNRKKMRYLCAIVAILYVFSLCSLLWIAGCRAVFVSKEIEVVQESVETFVEDICVVIEEEPETIEESLMGVKWFPVTTVTEDKKEEVMVSSVVSYSAPARSYYDVPLSDDLQDHIFEVCDSYEVDAEIVFAMIRKESTYRAGSIGDNGNAFGLMQVQPRWHQARMDKLGVTDLLDPYQNIRVGVDYLAELIGRGKGVEWALMAYNGGPGAANNAGKQVTYYKNTVLSYVTELNWRE